MRLAILAIAILAGCSTQEKQVVLETTPPVFYSPIIIDEQCAEIAKYSRAIGLYKFIGIPIESIELLIKVNPEFPLEAISRRVYSNNNADPFNETGVTYNLCVEESYNKFLDRLHRENAIYKMQEIEEAKLTEEKLTPKPEEVVPPHVKKHTVNNRKKKK